MRAPNRVTSLTCARASRSSAISDPSEKRIRVPSPGRNLAGRPDGPVDHLEGERSRAAHREPGRGRRQQEQRREPHRRHRLPAQARARTRPPASSRRRPLSSAGQKCRVASSLSVPRVSSTRHSSARSSGRADRRPQIVPCPPHVATPLPRSPFSNIGKSSPSDASVRTRTASRFQVRASRRLVVASDMSIAVATSRSSISSTKRSVNAVRSVALTLSRIWKKRVSASRASAFGWNVRSPASRPAPAGPASGAASASAGGGGS